MESKPIDCATEHKLKKKSLETSIYDGSAYSVMDSFTANFITPFALSMKASNTFISILATLPGLISVIFQFFTINFVKFLPRKKTLVIGAFLQGFTWLPIAFAPFYAKEQGPYALLALITLNAIFSATINPIWSSMMGDLVPEDSRGKYFARRNSICGVIAFFATFIAGYTLDIFSKHMGMFPTFALMFTIAFVFRTISVYFLAKMYDPPFEVSEKSNVSFFYFLSNIKESNYGRFTLYLCAMSFAANISSPFLVVYMLNELKFSYLQFTVITLASVTASFISMIFWGKHIDKSGNKKALMISGMLIPFIPLMWLISSNYSLLLIVEIFSGIAWAGFNLSSSNFVYDATNPQKRTSYIVYLNLLKGMSVFIAAVIGGFLSKHLEGVLFTSGIAFLFLVSGILRLSTSIYFFRQIKEMRLIEIPLGHSLFDETITIVPRQNIIYQPSGVYIKKHKTCVEVKPKPKTTLAPVDVHERRHLMEQYFKIAEHKDIDLEQKKRWNFNNWGYFKRSGAQRVKTDFLDSIKKKKLK